MIQAMQNVLQLAILRLDLLFEDPEILYAGGRFLKIRRERIAGMKAVVATMLQYACQWQIHGRIYPATNKAISLQAGLHVRNVTRCIYDLRACGYLDRAPQWHRDQSGKLEVIPVWRRLTPTFWQTLGLWRSLVLADLAYRVAAKPTKRRIRGLVRRTTVFPRRRRFLH